MKVSGYETRGGVRRITWHSRRGAFAPLIASASLRRCVSAWSLADMRPPHPRKTGKTFVEDEVSLEKIFVGDKDEGCGAITEDTGAFGA